MNQQNKTENIIETKHTDTKPCAYIDGLVQERRNAIANALELRLSYSNPSISGRHGRQICGIVLSSSSSVCTSADGFCKSIICIQIFN